MKTIKELLAKLKQKELSFATKQWIIIIAAMLLGICMSDLDDYLYRHNDAFRYAPDAIVLIGAHQIEGAIYGLKFALAAVILNIICRVDSEPRKKTSGMRKGLKIVGFIGLVLFTLILWLLLCSSGISLQPDSNYVFYVYFMLYILLRKEKWPYWVTTLSIFIIMGIWFVFFSNYFDIHPIRVAHDSIKAPWQYHLPRFCFGGYGLYWCGRVIAWTSLFGGIVSIVILIQMRVIRGIYRYYQKISRLRYLRKQKLQSKQDKQ